MYYILHIHTPAAVSQTCVKHIQSDRFILSDKKADF